MIPVQILPASLSVVQSWTIPDDALMSSTPSTSTEVSPDEIDDELVHTMLQEQQKLWEDAITDTQNELTDTLDPPIPLDHQMICDIQKIASRLATKSIQLLGKLNII